MSPMTAKTYTTEVICLKTLDFGEADRILQMYSPEHGRISVIAKGVKKPKSKLAGACELLNISEVQLSKGKNLDVLCQYQPRASFPGLRVDLLKLAYGLLFGELLLQTTADADEDSESVYAQVVAGLKGLEQAEDQAIVPFSLRYQMRWLESAGYHPVLNACLFTGEPLDESALYYCFSPTLGGVTTPARKRREQEAHPAQGAGWVNVTTKTLRLLADPFAGWEGEQLLKAQKFLRYYFGQVFERNLRAYELVMNLLEAETSKVSVEQAAN
jgi:DNA repair protein RecO (recombination protein O)